MTQLFYVPVCYADYFADTTHLTAEESGAYLHLLFHMWNLRGTLPNKPELLRRYARVEKDRWAEVWQQLEPFFTHVNQHTITQKRLRAELERATKTHNLRRQAGKRGATAKRAVTPPHRQPPGKRHTYAVAKPKSLQEKSFSGSQALANPKPGTSTYTYTELRKDSPSDSESKLPRASLVETPEQGGGIEDEFEDFRPRRPNGRARRRSGLTRLEGTSLADAITNLAGEDDTEVF